MKKKKKTKKKTKKRSSKRKSKSKKRKTRKKTSKKRRSKKKRKKRSSKRKSKSKKRKTRKKTSKKRRSKKKRKKLKLNIDYNNPSQVKKHLLEKEEHHFETSNSPKTTMQKMFSEHGFYRYVWFPFLLLFFSLFLNFALELVIYSQISIYYISFVKNTFFFNAFIFLLFFINVFAYFYLGYIGATKNFPFRKVFSAAVNITAVLLIFEIILTFTSFVTFLRPFVLTYFPTLIMQKLYFIYLLAWIICKAVIYLVIMGLSYLFFFKAKFKKI